MISTPHKFMITICKLSNKPACIVNPAEVELQKYLVGGACWVDVTINKPEDVRVLANVFNFHQLSIDDCLDNIHYPKVEQFPDYLFIILHTVEVAPAAGKFSTKEADFFLTNKHLVTVHRGESKRLLDIKERLIKEAFPTSLRPDLFFQLIASKYTDDYFPVLEALDKEIDGVEDLVLKGQTPSQGDSNTLTSRILHTKKRISMLKRLLTPQRDVFSQLARDPVEQIAKSTMVYFRDIYDRLFHITEMLDSYRDVLSSTLEAYLSVVSNRLNEVMKVLTIVTVILLPMSLIAGIYGMNFRFMPELYQPWGYPAVLGLMIAVALSLVGYFKRRGWL